MRTDFRFNRIVDSWWFTICVQLFITFITSLSFAVCVCASCVFVSCSFPVPFLFFLICVWCVLFYIVHSRTLNFNGDISMKYLLFIFFFRWSLKITVKGKNTDFNEHSFYALRFELVMEVLTQEKIYRLSSNTTIKTYYVLISYHRLFFDFPYDFFSLFCYSFIY